MKLCKKFLIKIPGSLKLVYRKKTNSLLIIGLLNNKIIKLNFKIIILDNTKSIYVTDIAENFFSNIRRKKKNL